MTNIQEYDTEKNKLDQLSQLDHSLLKKKKKSKNKLKKSVEESKKESVKEETSKETDYTWLEMYERIKKFMIRDKVNPHIRKFTLPTPMIEKVNKKLIWSNYLDICTKLHRDKNHVMSYFLAELSANGSLTEKGHFIIITKASSKEIQILIKKYMEEYVTCKVCKNNDSSLIKNPETRLLSVVCDICRSITAVKQIKQGFRVVKKKHKKE